MTFQVIYRPDPHSGFGLYFCATDTTPAPYAKASIGYTKRLAQRCARVFNFRNGTRHRPC